MLSNAAYVELNSNIVQYLICSTFKGLCLIENDTDMSKQGTVRFLSVSHVTSAVAGTRMLLLLLLHSDASVLLSYSLQQRAAFSILSKM